jgi:hypothetical protein
MGDEMLETTADLDTEFDHSEDESFDGPPASGGGKGASLARTTRGLHGGGGDADIEGNASSEAPGALPEMMPFMHGTEGPNTGGGGGEASKAPKVDPGTGGTKAPEPKISAKKAIAEITPILAGDVGEKEAVKAIRIVRQVRRKKIGEVIDGVGRASFYKMIDHLPQRSRDTATFTYILRAMGPGALEEYVERKLSYSILDLDLIVTPHEASIVGGVLRRLEPAARQDLFDRMGRSQQKILFDMLPDASIFTMKMVLKLRFGITFQKNKTPHDGKPKKEDKGVEWEAGGLRRLWNVLEPLPPHHVQGNEALDFMERYQGANKEGWIAGFYWEDVGPGYGRDEAALAYRPEDIATSTMEDGAAKGANAFDHVARHEVGHAVDSAGGFSDNYCYDNAAGGFWQDEDTDTMAADLVAASGEEISSWSDAGQKTKIISTLQKFVTTKQQIKKAKIEKALKKIDGLTDEDVEKIMKDKAIKALKAGRSDPWEQDDGGVALNGRIYQESYEEWWTSYRAEARDRKVSNYQFRAPPEWFAEAYAVYYQPGKPRGELLEGHDKATKKFFDSKVHTLERTRDKKGKDLRKSPDDEPAPGGAGAHTGRLAAQHEQTSQRGGGSDS